MHTRMHPSLGLVASTLGLLLLVAWLLGPVLGCADACFADYETLRGSTLGMLEVPDARLNAWILAWVQEWWASGTGSLFDANAFHPAPNALAGSEHLLGVAVLLWPLRLVGANAIALHQSALVLSFLLLGLTSMALVRWLTASTWAGFVAGAVAILMPWRISELSHIQLLNAQWFPLVWLGVGRIVYGDTRRRTTAWLSLAATVQVLTSFYLAYFLVLSTLVLVLVVCVRSGVSRAAFLRLGVAAIAPAVLLGAVALPYLEWRAASGFVPLTNLFDSVRPGDAWSVIGPRLELGWRGGGAHPISYEVPLVVFVLGLLALFARPPAVGSTSPIRGFTPALWVMSLAAFVLALGQELELGAASYSLPAAWIGHVVPGFSTLRNPLRWAVVIGLAFPVLAGIGAAAIERRLADSRSRVDPFTRRMGLRVALVALLALSLPAAPVPVRAAWEAPTPLEKAYRALAALPAGSVLEVPWPQQDQRNIDLSSRYMLSSTMHWKPIANGTSGYAPPSEALLRQVAQRLPRPDALALLHRLTDTRWIVVHDDRLLPDQRGVWTHAAARGALRRVYANPPVRIFEVPGWDQAGDWTQALVSPEPRPHTFSGLPRTPLAADAVRGTLQVLEVARFELRGGRRIPRLVPVALTNDGDVSWPGLDVDSEGLVRLRYRWRSPDGSYQVTELAPLLTDVPSGKRIRAYAPILGPRHSGPMSLRLDLVQRLGDEERALPIDAVELEVEVMAADRHVGGP
jgi:hypothetical protein